ncbi:MAG: hypothetical protein PHW92_11280 [Lutibacter sp.]|nr:hypothetical protein [Lutibacter sp.]
MLLDILTLYFLGLSTLLLSDFLGLILLRFRNNNIFLLTFIGYLAIVATYAIFKAGGNSVGLFIIMWIVGYIFIIKKKQNFILIKKQDYLCHLLIISTLWTIIFILKVSYFWNFEYNSPNLLFNDYAFYMKVAEGYNLTGNENGMGLRNVLFPFLNFAQPYRSNDFWLVSLGLDLTKIDTIYIWELFYSTISIFICSLSLFVILKRKFNLIWSLILSILVLFAFSGHWYRDIINLIYSPNSGSYDPIGIIAYTKLAIVFSVIFHFFYKYERGQKEEAIYLLILIPLLVQSAIAVVPVIFLIILFYIYQERKISINSFKRYLPLIGVFSFLIVGFLLFYILNQQKEQFYLGYSNMNISNNDNIIDFIIQFFKKSILLFISYYWLSCFLVVILLLNTKSLNKIFRLELFVFLLLFYFSGMLVYAKYNKIGDAYQFSTNVFGPFVLSLIIYLLIQSPIKTLLGKIKLATLILVSLVGIKQIIGGNNVFHSTTRIHYYDKAFINEVKKVLPKLNYPLGIIYYGEDLQNYPREDFPQNNSTFLKLFGRNYDVFNIEADSLELDLLNKANQKSNLYINKNALNIWHNNSGLLIKSKSKLGREEFYDFYPFSFCISKKSKEELPYYIKLDIIRTIRDKNSKIYFYILKKRILKSVES